jgi:hypothetical protein
MDLSIHPSENQGDLKSHHKAGLKNKPPWRVSTSGCLNDALAQPLTMILWFHGQLLPEQEGA